MKKLFLLFTLSLFILSCDKAKEEKTQEKKDSEKEIVYSENIQDTFFGVKFGASREEVIKAFEKEGLYLDERESNRDRLWFFPLGKTFSFGGEEWHRTIAALSNGKFFCIIFARFDEDKESLLRQFESVLSTLSTKYKMNESEDPSCSKCYTAESKDGKRIEVLYCDSISTKSIMLFYSDDTLNKSSDEL